MCPTVDRVEWRTVVRKLAPDELPWFLSRSLAFQGHRDPMGFAQRVAPRLRDARRDAAHAFVLVRDGAPVAGAYALPPDRDEHDQSMFLSQLWFEHSPDALTALVGEILRRNPHEAVYFPLHGLVARTVDRLGEALGPLGFELDTRHRLRFDLVDVPPLGTPLVLEAWSLEKDAEFRALFERAEGPVTERTWAWLKRKHGPFFPDLWFSARATLDQEPIGFALCGANDRGIDASFYLTAVGVLGEHRDTSEMLRRVVVSTLEELSVQSPMGRIETTLSTSDPKLIAILRSLGFKTVDRYDSLVNLPR